MIIFFSSIPLMPYLKKDRLWPVDTIWKDRLKGADKHLLIEKDLKKKWGGSFDSTVEAIEKKIAMKREKKAREKLTTAIRGAKLLQYDVDICYTTPTRHKF